ncbi:MAG: relaxase/mobilization nuclease domain-containing protein [Micavibrio aeruginosavorus]|nr:relaxase/mobilization nuclease domain-containing protein [Micavibrio aeruginosavorus]
MIPFASQRGGGQDLATHLLNAHDNELTELVHLRGAVADDLHGAFREWEVQAQSLTRCSKYLYSMSINPDPAHGTLTREQYMDYIRRAEEALGLSEQPRAVVFHVKHGREHCHVVWSRIDVDQKRAVHLAFDHDKLMRVTRSFARDHGLALPDGYDTSRQVGQISLYEQEQSRQTGLSKEDHIREVTGAWRQCDDPRAFVQALAERGYILATGKRPYVVVDLYGNMNALPKLIDDKTVRTSDLRKFLEKDFPVESLPSVEEAQALAAAHRKLIEKSADENLTTPRIEALKHAQEERRRSTVEEAVALKAQHQAMQEEQQTRHWLDRDALRSRHLEEMRAIRRQRFENRPTGLAAFLGRITGVAFVQKLMARREDARRVKAYLEDRAALKTEQRAEQRILAVRLKIQATAAEQKIKSLEKVEKRECAALLRESKAAARSRQRDEEGPPSLAHPPVPQSAPRSTPALPEQFAQAQARNPRPAPDVLGAFSRAADAARAKAGRGDGDTRKPTDPDHTTDKGRSR